MFDNWKQIALHLLDKQEKRQKSLLNVTFRSEKHSYQSMDKNVQN